MMNANHTIFNAAQLKLLDLFSVLKTKEDLDGLQKVVSEYLATRLRSEIDELWNDGTLTDEKVESFRSLHERTPYKKPSL